MIDVMKRLDPAIGQEVNSERLRALVDEHLGVSTTLKDRPRSQPKAWLVAAAAFLLVLVVGLPALLRQEGGGSASDIGALLRHPGVDTAIPLASGGVQTAAVGGDTIWVLTSLAHQLQEVSASSGELMATHTIEPYAEGVVSGGGFVWLMSYDNDGEVLRFDPRLDSVDMAIPIGGDPRHAIWAGESLWVSNDQGDLHRIDAEGEIVATTRGELKGEGLGYLWVNDPETGLISNLTHEGEPGEIVIPTYSGLETSDGWGVRSLIESGGDLWLFDGDYPWGTNVSRFDPSTGELSSFVGITFGLLGFTEFDGYLWVASNTDHVVARIDPVTAEVVRFPVPGKVGGLLVADGSLWATVYQWGALIRLNATTLPQSGSVAVDDWNRFPHRFLCTGNSEADGPTIIMEPYDWIDYGSWSVVQVRLSAEGYLVCVNGFVEGEASPQTRADELSKALSEAGLTGPFVLVSNGDGVHASRVFADGRSDIAGVVLVDPMAIGFGDFLDELEPDAAGHPLWSDLTEDEAEDLGDFGELPMTVIGHDPERVYLNPGFVNAFGRETAEAVEQFWQDGLDFYAGLSTNSNEIVATGSGIMVIWDDPDLVVDQILEMVDQVRG